MGDGYIHGGTDAREVARLEKQAAFVSPRFLERFDAAPGTRVLDLATGVGAMAGQLLARFPKIHLTGVDRSGAQLATARANHPGPAWVRADGARLPFPSGTFDRVHWSWFLEHVSKATAVAVLREVRRVLVAGGCCHFIEVDNSTFGTEPKLPRVLHAIDALNQGQIRAGGDPFVGPRVEGYLREAGFARIDVRGLPLKGDSSDPVFFRGFIDEFAEIFEGLDEVLGADPETLRGIADLRGLATLPGSSIHYCATIAQACK